MSDPELLEKLKLAGFDVPEFVIATWGSAKSKPSTDGQPNRRRVTERWVKRTLGMKGVRGVPVFPQWLAGFDVRIRRRLVRSRDAKLQPIDRSAAKQAGAEGSDGAIPG